MTARRSSTRAIGLLLIGLLVVAGVASGPALGADQVIGQPQLGVHVVTNQFTPGQQVTLNLYLTNTGQLTIGGPSAYESRVTTARSTLISVSAGDSPIRVETPAYPAGSVPEGSHGPYPITLTIPESVSPGTYHLPVTVDYTYTHVVDYSSPSGNPQYSDSEATLSTSVSVQVKNAPQFTIQRHDAAVQVGQRGNYTLVLQNTGNQVAHDATVSIKSSAPAIQFGTGSATIQTYVGEWAPGTSKTVHVPVSVAATATVSPYAIAVTPAYTDPDGIQHTGETLHTGLTPAPQETFALRNVSSDLRVGQDGTVTATVVNTGPAVAHAPSLVLPAPSPTVTVAEPAHALPDLRPGGTATVQFSLEVAAGADAGPIQLAPVVKYTDAAGHAYQSDPLRTGVQIHPHRDVFQLTPGATPLRTGGDNQPFTVSIANAGNQHLTNIQATIKLPGPSQSSPSLFGSGAGQPLTIADGATYLGTLAPGESQTTAFAFNVSETATAKPYPAVITFQYQKPDGSIVTSAPYTVPVTVARPRATGGFSLPLPIIGGAAIILVGLVLGLYLWRQRSPDEPD